MLPVRSRSRLLGAAFATLVTAGCGGGDASESTDSPDATATADPTASAAASPSGDVPEGWERFESAEGGFAISVPRGWEAVDLSSGDIDAMVELLREDPQTAALADQLPAMLEQGVAFFAVNLDADSMASGFATNLNVVVQEDVTMSLDLYVAGNVSFIEETFGVDVAREDVELPAGPAVRGEFEASFGEGTRVHQIQYYLVVDDRALIVTFSRAADDEFAELDDEFADIIDSLEILP